MNSRRKILLLWVDLLTSYFGPLLTQDNTVFMAYCFINYIKKLQNLSAKLND